MARSRRRRPVRLTRVKKVGRARKLALVERIHTYLDKYDHVYVFDYTTLRMARSMQLVRQMFNDSYIIQGKAKVMAIALGRSPEESQGPNLYKLTAFLKGRRGLLMTNQPSKEVKQKVQAVRFPEYHECGETAVATFTIPRGPLDPNRFPVTMDPLLRKLGLSTKVVRGVVEVTQDHTVCEEGKPITREASKLLRLWRQMLTFSRITLLAHWRKVDGVATAIKQKEETKGEAS
eukprot:RCo009660